MKKHGMQLHVRISQEELAAAKRAAQDAGMTLSDYIRVLVQAPTKRAESPGLPVIVIDALTAVKLQREMRRWGHHYNQACHALNAIAYYLRLDEADAQDALEELQKVSTKLEAMDSGVARLRESVAEVARHPMVYR